MHAAPGWFLPVLLLLRPTEALMLPRRATLGLATPTATAPRRSGAPAIASAAPSARARDALLEALRQKLRTPSLPPLSAGEGERLDALDVLVSDLVLLNPTPKPGSTLGWRVAFAPHITKLSALALARFDPIYYVLDGRGGIESNVQYSWLGGVLRGWLSTRGSYGSRDEDEVSYVEWDSAWWDPGADRPSRDAADGFAAPIVSALGGAAFISAFANFPVKYLDRDVCVFVFPLSGTRIVAVREGGALDVWRQSE